MNIDRLKKLENFLAKDPEDPFLIYALALEWTLEDPDKSKDYFDLLLEKHENYIGTYYHAAKLYASLGNKVKADDIFRKGIIIAEQSGDQHALRELKSAYDEFLFEDEED